MEDPKIDSLTDRPRAPNVPYTVLSDEQVKNMKKVKLFLVVHFVHDFYSHSIQALFFGQTL